jgi:para-nitrobenzyl esterase
VPSAALIAAQDQVTVEQFGATGVMPFAPAGRGARRRRPVLDGFALGRGGTVPLVLGTTRDELRLFPDPSGAGLDDQRLERRVARLIPGASTPDTIAAYRARLGPGQGTGDLWEAIRTDARLRIPALRLAEARAASGHPAYLYRFDWAAPAIGAAHAVDLPFTFGTFDREGWGDAVGHDAAADTLSSHLRGAWAAFAATGSPSQDDLRWPPYCPPDRPVMLFDRVSRVADDPDAGVRGCYP